MTFENRFVIAIVVVVLVVGVMLMGLAWGRLMDARLGI